MDTRQRYRILIVDDEPDALTVLESILESKGFEVVTAPDGVSALRAAYQTHPDLILLDIMMPGMDGFEVCRRLREMTEVPIIFLTAKGAIEDVVRGFSLGADDYVVKPYSQSELMGRINACLRRVDSGSDKRVEALFPDPSVMLDCKRRELMIKNRIVYLNPKEFEVLRLLLRHAGKVLSTDAILSRVWGPERVGDPDLVKQYIYRLRRKIEPDPESPQFLHTVRGAGYFFETSNLL